MIQCLISTKLDEVIQHLSKNSGSVDSVRVPNYNGLIQQYKE